MNDSTSLKFPNLKASSLAALICLVAATLVAVSTITLNQGFGAGDLWAFLFWTLPLVGIIAGIASFQVDLYCRLNVFVRIIAAVLAGALSGLVWTFVVAAFLGAWFGAFSFPVLFCWIAGGASGMIGSTLACSRVARGKFIIEFIIESILIVAICLLAVVGPKPFFIWVSHDQKLYMLTLKLIATPASELTIDARTRTYDLTADDITMLKSLDLRGRLEGCTQAYYGDGKPGRAIIIMQHQLESPVELPQPDGTTIVYVQDGDKWKMYPVNAPTLKRTIRLEGSESGNDVTIYWVEHADGGKTGGQAVYWH